MYDIITHCINIKIAFKLVLYVYQNFLTGGDRVKKYLKGIGFYLLLFLVILMVFFMTRVTPKQDKDVYSELVRDIQNHEVSEISIADDVATVKMKNSDSIIKVEVPGYETLRSDVGDEMEKQINCWQFLKKRMIQIRQKHL